NSYSQVKSFILKTIILYKYIHQMNVAKTLLDEAYIYDDEAYEIVCSVVLFFLKIEAINPI
ncbi:MAG: hypothetical protein RL060_357, partial [Bacteroidota bacterium]